MRWRFDLSSLAESKDLLRQAFLDRRSRLSQAEQENAGEAVVAKLIGQKEIFNALEIGLYWGMRGELPTMACFKKLKGGERHLYFPRLNKLDQLEFVEISHEKELRKGTFGVLEPDPTLSSVSLEQLEVLIIPGVAFDLQGKRLGWGKGYYDKTLKDFAGMRVGLAYDFQVKEKIPAGDLDEPVDVIITPSRVIECNWR
jgi:5-formyltetrahydrofolate cyclo-ligase